jgi:hypothetical protein
MPVEWALGNVNQVLPGGAYCCPGGNGMTTVINIHAKFGKTLVMNDRSPWLPLNHKDLQGHGLLQNS